MDNKIIIVSAPSGAGKTTIVNKIMEMNAFNLEFSISACTRTKRDTEKNGVNYYFISVAEFKEKIASDAFIEWEEVYTGRYYGTLKSEITRIWNKQHNIIFDVDVAGGISIKNLYPDKAISIFIMPPSVSELRNRLMNRSTDSEQEINMRVAKANKEIEMAKYFDYQIINDNLDIAVEKVSGLLTRFLKK